MLELGNAIQSDLNFMVGHKTIFNYLHKITPSRTALLKDKISFRKIKCKTQYLSEKVSKINRKNQTTNSIGSEVGHHLRNSSIPENCIGGLGAWKEFLNYTYLKTCISTARKKSIFHIYIVFLYTYNPDNIQ